MGSVRPGASENERRKKRRKKGRGYLFLTDRKSFMIISGGVNIYPQETENLLILHPVAIPRASASASADRMFPLPQDSSRLTPSP